MTFEDTGFAPNGAPNSLSTPQYFRTEKERISLGGWRSLCGRYYCQQTDRTTVALDNNYDLQPLHSFESKAVSKSIWPIFFGKKQFKRKTRKTFAILGKAGGELTYFFNFSPPPPPRTRFQISRCHLIKKNSPADTNTRGNLETRGNNIYHGPDLRTGCPCVVSYPDRNPDQPDQLCVLGVLDRVDSPCFRSRPLDPVTDSRPLLGTWSLTGYFVCTNLSFLFQQSRNWMSCTRVLLHKSGNGSRWGKKKKKKIVVSVRGWAGAEELPLLGFKKRKDLTLKEKKKKKGFLRAIPHKGTILAGSVTSR